MFHQSTNQILVTFKDVAACFSEEEWKLLHEREKLFYIGVMQKIHQALLTLGYHILNPETLLRVIKCEDVYQRGPKNPDSRTDLQDPTSYHDPSADPTPDILFGIKYEDEKSCMDLQSSGQTEIATVPSTGPSMPTPYFSLQIKEEAKLGSMDSEGRETLACDTAHHSAISPSSEVVLRIQQEPCGRDAASPEEGKMTNSPDTVVTAAKQRRPLPPHSPPPLHPTPAKLPSRLPASGLSPSVTANNTAGKRKRTPPPQPGTKLPTAVVPGPPMLTPYFSQQIKEEDKLGSMDSEGRETLACDTGHQIIPSETLLQFIKSEDSANEDVKYLKSQTEFPETTSSHHSAISPSSEVVLQIQQEQCGRDAASPEEGKMTNSPDTENGNLVETESLPTNQRKLNLQRENWDLAGEEYEQSTELIKKLVHLQNSQLPCTSVKCEKHPRDNATDRPFKSTEFEKTCNDLSALKMHHRFHAGGKLCECSECEKSSRDPSTLKKDYKIHTGEKPFRCTECNKDFFYISARKLHERIQIGEKPYECSECDRSFSDPSTLKRHCRIHTREKPFQCRVCSKCFGRQSDLKVHQRTHTGEKPFECTWCKKIFTRLSSLKQHYRIHTGEKPFECKECKQCFRYSSDLKEHQSTHTGEKPYECTRCKKIFTRLFSLKQHHRIHTGEKPFECKECKQCFRYSSDLKDHQRTHTGEYPYECTSCKKVYSHLSTLKKHHKIHTECSERQILQPLSS